MMDIVIDFDGTVVTHDFPEIGQDIGAVPVLKELVKNGHKLILFTMRSDGISGEYGLVKNYLQEAVDWFKKNDIPLYGVQRNPTQDSWTSSPKAYGQLIIDDAALGCPLKFDKSISLRPFVDWGKVRESLLKEKII